MQTGRILDLDEYEPEQTDDIGARKAAFAALTGRGA